MSAISPPRASSTFGTALLLRIALRRDRLLAAACLSGLLAICVASAAATPGLYPEEASRVRAAESMNSSLAIVALYGPILDVRSVGEVAMTKMTVLYAAFIAVLFVVLVRRHTRVEEESGRAELVAGTGIGRDAPLAATVVEVTLLAGTLGVLTAAANALAGLDLVGSIAFGGVWAGTGLVAAGVGAVAAQLSASARTCAGYAAAVVGGFFVLRALGDTGPALLSWLSPLGWNTQVRAYSETRWWLLGLYPVLAAGLFAAARLLHSRRDLGAGLVTARPGPSSGSPHLAGPLSLACKVHATTLALWTVAVAVLGVLFGMITPGIGDLLESEAAQTVLDQLGGALVAAILSVIAVVVSHFAAAVVSHAGRDEEQGRAELVLSTAAGRARWFAATTVLALAGSAWLLVVTGAGLWVGYAAAGGPEIGNLVVAAVAWVPAVWVVGGLSVLCLAVRPAGAALAWAWPGAFLTLVIVGELLELPGWIVRLSPYSHVPPLPAASWSWGAEIGLTATALALLLVAWRRFEARDLG